ncbi:phosphatase PAP2 family protein [Pseudomonas sp. NPDC007930]|uniref:phosphatase PAP2 family protein n=1 Tax=Pseudomonas sp. NPDC007930 TaxID=3364417 RepID=UPI0036EAD1BD
MRFYLYNLGIPLLCALAIFVAFDLTDLDLHLSNLLWDPAQGSFLYGHNELFERVTHKWARILPDWVGEGAVIGLLASLVWPLLARLLPPPRLARLQGQRLGRTLKAAASLRRDCLYITLAFALSTGLIHYFKSHTGIYCPVETVLYGGSEAKLEWYRTFRLFAEAGSGRCWPGGHASSAFSLVALYFVARRHGWAHSSLLLLVIGLLGMLYGTTRVLQGWHFMSHTLWAAVIVWLPSFGMALACYGRAALEQPLARRRERSVGIFPIGNNG